VGHEGLATVVAPVQLPQLRRVLNDSIERALREAAQVAADRGVPVGRL
jgi:spore coat protein CotF